MSGTSPSLPDFSSVSRNDQVLLGAGLLTFIFSFIDFAHVHVSGVSGLGSISGSSISAWHGIGTLAGLLVLLATAVAAVGVFAPATFASMPVSYRVGAGGLGVLSLIFFLIRWVTLPSYSYLTVHAGYKLAWGGYVTLILNIVLIAFAFLGMKQAGEAMPWQQSAGGTPPAPANP